MTRSRHYVVVLTDGYRMGGPFIWVLENGDCAEDLAYVDAVTLLARGLVAEVHGFDDHGAHCGVRREDVATISPVLEPA